MRVSRIEQDEALQRDALEAAGCEKFFLDKTTGVTFERKGLDEALAFLRPGDTLVIIWLNVGTQMLDQEPFVRRLNQKKFGPRFDTISIRLFHFTIKSIFQNKRC